VAQRRLTPPSRRPDTRRVGTGQTHSDVLLSLMRGFVVTKALYSAAVLGVADQLDGGPRSVDDLAAACHCRPDMLARLLRALASSGVFEEPAPGMFALTPIGALLRSEPPSLRNWVLLNGGLVYRVFEEAVETVRTGEPASPRALGRGFFDHLALQPAEAEVFDRAMHDMTAGAARLVIDTCDLTDAGSVVDVGGGDGTLLKDLLRARPGMQGVVIETPDVVSRAERSLEVPALAGRLQFRSGDFFESLPAGADVYLLAWILHDWDDEAAGRILAACRRAMVATSRLLVLESVLPPGDVPHFSRYGDLVMMVLFNGRERTESDFARLFEEHGLRLHAVHTTSTPRSVLDVRLAAS
jgi:hypothetical protein